MTNTKNTYWIALKTTQLWPKSWRHYNKYVLYAELIDAPCSYVLIACDYLSKGGSANVTTPIALAEFNWLVIKI